MNSLRAGNPKLAFCVNCHTERATVKGYVGDDIRRKRRICIYCRQPVEAQGRYGNIQPKRCGRNQLHQSTLEAAHCDKLHLMQHAGVIEGLQAHPQRRFSLDVGGEHIATYVADFVYHAVVPDGVVQVVADTKGPRPEVYRIKKRLMKAVLGIEILELGSDF